ncbi:hypothetical protein SAMN05443247_07909 [Bradyrhizobium erythrophlei]|nr:hypothetical protein SAMN05443247_07909 [Bradyrhizobium erythrophlei]
MAFPMSHADLKELSLRLRRRIKTLYTLGEPNDPFLAGQPSRTKRANWITDLLEGMDLPQRVHDRLVHYKLISQDAPVLQADDAPYVNSVECFDTLCESVRDARYLGLIPADMIVDRRNPAPTINRVNRDDDDGEVTINDGEVERHTFDRGYKPPEIELPSTSLWQKPTVGQRYHLEIWIEKSTANDILLPLGREYGINIATFIGEVSATACKNLVDRAIASNRPVRILYVSDFDPAGRDMPISASVKIDYFARKSGVDLDIRLETVALTLEQCIEYKLPRTPIKDTEKRADAFEARFGAGATELDALEALHPGALREILLHHILRFHDPDLADEVSAAVQEYEDDLESAEEAIEEQFAEEIKKLNEQRDRIAAAFDRVHGPAKAAYDRIVRLAGARYDRALESVREEVDQMENRLVAEAEPVLAQMKDALSENLPAPDLPEPAEGDEDDDALYDSTRDYVAQVDIFRAHKGRDDNIVLARHRPRNGVCKFCGKSFIAFSHRKMFCDENCGRKYVRRDRDPPQAA